MRLSFRAKVILGIAAIELLMFSLLIVNDLKLLVSSHREAMQDTVETTFSTFESATVNAIASIDTATLDELTRRLAATPTVKYAVIENADGAVLSYAQDAKGLIETAKTLTGDIESADDRIFRDRIRVEIGGMALGSIYLGFDTRKILETKEVARERALRIALLGLCLSAVFSFVFGTILSRRLRKLKKGAERIAAANYDAGIDDTGHDEVAEVSRAFNTMIENLKCEQERASRYQTELQRMNNELEDRVQKRTQELSHSNAKLHETIDALKQTQAQLLQSEKMASIGQLAAGVAHEINNPVGYVNSNISSLENYTKDILTLIDSYESNEPMIADAATKSALASLREQIDLEFLKTDLVSLIQESKEGLDRVKKIVQDLKEYSHQDKEEWDVVDLHAGIDSTLNIANNEIKYKAKLVKAYGEIPFVRCNLSQINQVIMNIVVNAAHAIESEPGEIRIGTHQEGDDVCISIADNGVGMEPSTVNKIFDPFYTTKPVGKGTGLGLSLSYNIIKKHQGRIEVNSTPGEGTEFRIWLPVNCKQAA